ncbi:hypothetical protein ACVWZ8_001615 [Arthrobacter sp. UYCu723]
MVVVPDRGGHGQQALNDPDRDARKGASEVMFEVQLDFEGIVDRFDDLPQGFEEP